MEARDAKAAVALVPKGGKARGERIEAENSFTE